MSESNKDTDRKQPVTKPVTKEEQSPKREKNKTGSGKVPPQIKNGTPARENRGD
jgi:hypothetical protein